MKSKMSMEEIQEMKYEKNVSFSSLFKGQDKNAVDLLRKILVYDPDKRLSA